MSQTFAEGMRAYLVLVEGRPDEDISAIRKTRRVFLNGQEVGRDNLQAEVSAPGVTPMAAVPAKRLIDDFEGQPARISNGLRRIHNTDAEPITPGSCMPSPTEPPPTVSFRLWQK